VNFYRIFNPALQRDGDDLAEIGVQRSLRNLLGFLLSDVLSNFVSVFVIGRSSWLREERYCIRVSSCFNAKNKIDFMRFSW
jgi:hypothetical protein